jgi:hypothetical protein
MKSRLSGLAHRAPGTAGDPPAGAADSAKDSGSSGRRPDRQRPIRLPPPLRSRWHGAGVALAVLVLLVGCQDRAAQAEQRQREDAFAASLAGAQLVIDADAYRLEKLERGAEPGQWVLHAGFRFAGVNLNLGVPCHLHWAGQRPVLEFRAVRVLAFGPYDTHLLFEGSRWCGVWSGPGGQGGHIGGTLLPAGK